MGGSLHECCRYSAVRPAIVFTNRKNDKSQAYEKFAVANFRENAFIRCRRMKTGRHGNKLMQAQYNCAVEQAASVRKDLKKFFPTKKMTSPRPMRNLRRQSFGKMR